MTRSGVTKQDGCGFAADAAALWIIGSGICRHILHQIMKCCSYFDADAIQWWLVSPWSSQILHLLTVLREEAFALIGVSASL